jgi:hypothetical protein
VQISFAQIRRRFGIRFPRVVRGLRGPCGLRGVLAGTALLASIASAAGAQTLPGLPLHTSATTRISAAVRPILTLTRVEIASVQDLETEARVSSRVAVRTNVPYRIAVRAAAVLNEQTGIVLVRDFTGAWVSLSNDKPVIVGQSAAGVNTLDVECRVVAGATGSTAAPADLDPQSCSLAYELAPQNDAAVLAAVAVLPVGGPRAAVGSRE